MGRILMGAQYIAEYGGNERKFAALSSQNSASDLLRYPQAIRSGIVRTGRSLLRLESIAGHMAFYECRFRTTSDRRYRCQRASNFWQQWALWSSLLPVRASSRSKNLSWLIQSRSAKSPSSRANSSKRHIALRRVTGRAFAPVLTAPSAGGAAWH